MEAMESNTLEARYNVKEYLKEKREYTDIDGEKLWESWEDVPEVVKTVAKAFGKYNYRLPDTDTPEAWWTFFNEQGLEYHLHLVSLVEHVNLYFNDQTIFNLLTLGGFDLGEWLHHHYEVVGMVREMIAKINSIKFQYYWNQQTPIALVPWEIDFINAIVSLLNQLKQNHASKQS
jgi:hypothetical protein